MSAIQEHLRFGSNEIRGYVHDTLTLKITPSTILLPEVAVDHLDMPVTFKDADVSADTILFTNNDSTHVQSITGSHDLTVAGPTVHIASSTAYVNINAETGFSAAGATSRITGEDSVHIVSSSGLIDLDSGTTVGITAVGDVTVTAPGRTVWTSLERPGSPAPSPPRPL